jgi:hypothetical protein
MQTLSSQYDRVRHQYPDDELLILFDIDGTILDMRHMVCWVLLAFDRAHDTSHFHGLLAETIKVHENQVEQFLDERPLPTGEKERILQWYLEHRWSPEAILASHQPYRGVLDVIRWLQIQPATHVGLNTGRPELLREATLRSLNALGSGYRVQFSSDLLYMNPRDWEEAVPVAKAAGLRFFQEAGFRVFAVVDNEPQNIKSMVEADRDGEILFLHAETLFETKGTQTPRTVRGRSYDITSLVSEEDLPQRVQFVWHGVNDRANLRQFLASGIRWGECDLRCDPLDRLVLRHDSFEETPWSEDEEVLTLEDCLEEFKRHDKAIKLDLKEDCTVERVLALLKQAQLDDGRLWFNGNVESLLEAGFRRLATSHPRAIIQCPADFLAPLILSIPDKAQEILRVLASWGINRLSVSWKTERKRQIVDSLENWGYEVNIYDVPDLESFLQAALLLPRSLTSDFNFPKWHYFGRGAGKKRDYFRYRAAEPTR